MRKRGSRPYKVKTISEQCYVTNGGYFPKIIKNQDNELCIFCRTGAGYYGKTGKISLFKSKDGIHWEDKGVVVEGSTDIRYPSIGILEDGTGYMAVSEYDAYHGKNGIADTDWRSKRTKFTIKFLRSDRSLENWNYDNTITVTGLNEIMYSSKLKKDILCNHLYSPCGRIINYGNKLILPLFDNCEPAILASSSQGKAWEEFEKIALGFNEIVLAVTSDDKLLAAISSVYEIYEDTSTWVSSSENYDNNNLKDTIWSIPFIVSGDDEQPADLTVLSNGCILMTVGIKSSKEQRIRLYLSMDNGHSWNRYVHIMMVNKRTYQDSLFGYPSTIEYEPGKLMTVYACQPNAPKKFNSKDPYYYQSKKAKGYVIRYSLDELMKTYKELVDDNRKWPHDPCGNYRKIWTKLTRRQREFLPQDIFIKEFEASGVLNKNQYQKERKKHKEWPLNPQDVYYISWDGLFHHNKVKTFIPLEQFLKELKRTRIKSSDQYRKQYKRHKGWPDDPQHHYNISWSKLLKDNIIKTYIPYKQFVKELKKSRITSFEQYRERYKRHKGWPEYPQHHYSISWVILMEIEARPYLSVHQFIRELKKSRIRTFKQYRKSYKHHKGWPSKPQQIYKLNWKFIIKFLSFLEN